MPLLNLPNEILYIISKDLKAKDLSSLLLTNRFLAQLITPILRRILVEDKDGLPALFWAAGKGYQPWCNLLLKMGFNPNISASNIRYSAPLHQAAKFGHKAVIELLLEGGAEVNVLDSRDDTPLHYAAGNGQKAAAHILLENGANIDAVNRRQKTALSRAIRKLVRVDCAKIYSQDLRAIASARAGAEETAIMLLENDANIFLPNIYGEIALHEASGQSSLEVLKLVLDLGGFFSLEARENGGNTALHIAIIYGQGAAVKLLLEENVNVNSQNMDGDTPLLLAVGWNREAILKDLIEAKANVNLQNLRNCTPIAWAAYRGYEKIVSLILEAGPSFNSTRNAAALRIAVHKGRPRIVRLLLESGAYFCIDLQWQPGKRTVLHDAAERGHVEIVRILLEKGADTKLLDVDNKCAFCAALENGSEDLLKLFTDHTAHCESAEDLAAHLARIVT